MKDKILLVLTGGTICSFADSTGEKSPDTKKADYLIKEIFKMSGSEFSDTEFDDKIPMSILSENMSPERWNDLIEKLREYDMESYRGVIILHGTDTLAYTSAMLSLVLAGLSVPVFMVSSGLPLNEEGANGNDNFRVAAELIMKGIKPNLYVPYRNRNGEMLLHFGGHLTQCPTLSNDFHSLSEHRIDIENPFYDGAEWESHGKLYERIGKFTNSVLKIEPYVGLDYSRISLAGVEAVCHGTFHSETLSVGDKKTDPYSVFSLKECFSGEIPLFLTPCRYEKGTHKPCYETTADAVENGAISIWGMTSEMVYVKAMVGVALGFSGSGLTELVAEKKINHEFHF